MIEPSVLKNPLNNDPEQLFTFLRIWLGERFVGSICHLYNQSIKSGLSLEGLHPFTYGFRDWYKFRMTGVMEFGFFQLVDYARRIRIFANEWNVSPYKEDFWKTIRNKKHCLGLMFTLQIGTHFLRAGYPVSLILDNRGVDKKLDLKIHHPKCVVGIECTRKKNANRWDSKEKLIDDLLLVIMKKAEVGYDYKIPRLLFVQIPIDVPIFDKDLREKIGTRLQEKFAKSGRYNSISFVFICSNDKFIELYLPNNRSLVSNSPTNLGWWNPNDRYNLVQKCPDLKVSLSFE